MAVSTATSPSGKTMKNIIFSLSVTLLAGIFSLPVYGNLLDIYVSIPPQKWLAEQLAGDRATIAILLEQSQDPHTFEPTPRQITDLSKAELYFTIGMTFEKHLTKKLEQANLDLKIIDSSHTIPRRDEEGHGHAESAGEHSSSHADPDPHIWLSPANLVGIARNMTDSMAAADTANRDVYERNYNHLERRLLDLHERIKEKLAAHEGARFFVFHPAFGYFADAYNLHQVAVEIEGKSPSPKQLFKIVSQARAEKIGVLFVQPQFDPNSARAVAQAIGGRVVALDPLAENVIVNIETMADAIVDSLDNRKDQ